MSETVEREEELIHSEAEDDAHATEDELGEEAGVDSDIDINAEAEAEEEEDRETLEALMVMNSLSIYTPQIVIQSHQLRNMQQREIDDESVIEDSDIYRERVSKVYLPLSILTLSKFTLPHSH